MLGRSRNGLTLVEIVVALTVTLMAAAAIYGLVTITQRVSQAQAERASLESNLRTGAWFGPAELHELSSLPSGTPAQNDLMAIGPTSITYRAMRGVGFLCQSPATSSELRVSVGSYSAYRDPAAGRDSALVFLEGDSLTAADDSWLPAAITDVAVGSSCAGGSGIRLTTDAHPEFLGLQPNTPIRIYEVMELRLYQSGGKSWLGAHSISAGEVVQPLLGPLVDGTGFTLEYLDGAGNPTADRTAVRTVGVNLHGVSESPALDGFGPRGRAQDSLVARISLRNAVAP
jgi:hypothetical protein